MHHMARAAFIASRARRSGAKRGEEWEKDGGDNDDQID